MCSDDICMCVVNKQFEFHEVFLIPFMLIIIYNICIAPYNTIF